MIDNKGRKLITKGESNEALVVVIRRAEKGSDGDGKERKKHKIKCVEKEEEAKQRSIREEKR